MNFASASRFVALVFALGSTAACGGPGATADGAAPDVVVNDAADHTMADVVGHDSPAADTADVATTDIASDTTADAPADALLDAPVDAPADASIDAPRTDVPTPTDTGPAPCTLPLGGTCARGTTCPAGDGCNTCSCPASGGIALCTLHPCAADAAIDVPRADAATPMCTTPSDCRLFSSYCSTLPCVCEAFTTTEPDPVCHGTTVACFLNPCSGHTADCVGGACVVR